MDSTDPIASAAAIGAQAAQIFLGDPQSWKAPTCLYPEGAAALKQAAAKAGLALYVHAPYVINVATTNNKIRIPSRKLLQQTVKLAAEVGALGVIVHGGHVQAGDDIAVGYDNWRKALEQTQTDVPILIENTAGGDHSVMRRLESIARLWDVAGPLNAGLCLDTCHAHAGGIELASAVDQVKAITGRVDLVHANGSRDAFDSGRDRHISFSMGDGFIPADAVLDVVKKAGCNVIVETNGTQEEVASDVAFLASAAAS